MKQEKKVGFDMSSFIWRGLLKGGDPEMYEVEHEGKKVKVSSAGWGYENVMNMMCRVLKETKCVPIDMILVFEGQGSKTRRELIDATYKSGRDTRPPQAYDEFHKLKGMLIAAWRNVGALCLTQPLAEGDDTLAWLALHTDVPLVVCSYDEDIAALNTPCNSQGVPVEVWKDGDVGLNPFGLFDHHLITMYKALVGDDSDTIKGCPGFGPKTFEKLCAEIGFDGLQELYDRCDNGAFGQDLHDMANEVVNIGKRVEKWVPANPLIRTLCDHEKEIITSFKLAKMHPEWVNTMTHPLVMEAGMVKEAPAMPDERLLPYYQQKVLVTAKNWENVLDQAQTLARDESPFLTFDIETSSADESDEWLERQGDPDGVDQMGSTLTGFSFTFGRNMHRTVYVSVEHRDTDNLRMSEARRFIERMVANELDVIIHNNHFELPVLYCAEDEDGTLWRDHWKDNGYFGFLPRSLDTKLEASYVNENEKLGLKHRSKLHLNYEQVSYDEVTIKTGNDLPYGGRSLGETSVVLSEATTKYELIPGDPDGGSQLVEDTPAVTEMQEVRRYKMNELPATHVFDYGCDDTICTAGQHVFYRFVMGIEQTWDVYKQVEIAASYQHAKNFVDGLNFSLQTCKELEKLDDKVYESAWATVRSYLIEQRWNGTVCPTFDADLKVSDVKVAFAIVFPGNELDTQVRSIAKVVKMLRDEAGGDADILNFANAVENCAAGDTCHLRAMVETAFILEPILNFDSPLQVQKLLFETMKLPVQIRNKPTPAMKARGLQGSPKTDELAIRYSMRVASPELRNLLDSLWLIRMISTRRELYYTKYPWFVHWKTGRIHPSHNQCGTNTRRASESKPNKQQLPKHQKVELSMITDAEAKAATIPRFREAIIPHHPDAVIVSMDFNAQELRNIAEQSQDETLLACYVGENLKDMHSLTGYAILKALKGKEVIPGGDVDRYFSGMAYDEFEAVKDKCDFDKTFKKTAIGAIVTDFRARGKKTNFTTEYGAMAPKLAATMLVSLEEAQMFIDARESMFPRVAEWKVETIEEAKKYGFVKTMMGARRHLRDALMSGNFMDASKAERQAVNTKVQGSCGEQTKLAEGRMFWAGLFFKYEAVCYGPVHDEVVASVVVDDNFKAFIKEMHACMVAPYANMKVPIVSSISFGPSFGVQFECGDLPTDEAIDKGLEAMRKAMRKEEAVAA